jgi:hypothetical protein
MHAIVDTTRRRISCAAHDVGPSIGRHRVGNVDHDVGSLQRPRQSLLGDQVDAVRR